MSLGEPLQAGEFASDGIGGLGLDKPIPQAPFSVAAQERAGRLRRRAAGQVVLSATGRDSSES